MGRPAPCSRKLFDGRIFSGCTNLPFTAHTYVVPQLDGWTPRLADDLPTRPRVAAVVTILGRPGNFGVLVFFADLDSTPEAGGAHRWRRARARGIRLGMAHFRFRGVDYPLGALRFHIDPTPGGSWWLIDGDRYPELLFGEQYDLSTLPTSLSIDNRALDEMLERLTGEMAMYWPPNTKSDTELGDIVHTQLRISPGPSPERLRVDIDAALVPDEDDGSGPHRLELSAEAELVRREPGEWTPGSPPGS